MLFVTDGAGKEIQIYDAVYYEGESYWVHDFTYNGELVLIDVTGEIAVPNADPNECSLV